MSSHLADDLKWLSYLAYHRLEWSQPDIEKYHRLLNQLGPAAMSAIDPLHVWMLVPITLWPFNIHDVFVTCLDLLEKGKTLPREMKLLLEMIPVAPDKKVCLVVAAHEHQVQTGSYEDLVTTSVKFESGEQAMESSVGPGQDWQKIVAAWDVASYRDHKGVIRRTIGAERNLRPSFKVDWTDRDQRFQAVFDAFCQRWNLYGMQGDQPLLLKLSVNLTPNGTMIFIPAYWSFDAKRDVKWSAVMRLHRARANKKQGTALTEGVIQRREMATKLVFLDQEAAARKLRGAKRHAFLCAGLGLSVETDPKRLARLRVIGRSTAEDDAKN